MTSRGTLSETPVEILLARYTWTADGAPLTPAAAFAELPGVRPASHGRGWFWTTATPAAAATIREYGHKAVGTLVTTWIPPQKPVEILPADEPTGDLRTRTSPDGVVMIHISPAPTP